MSFSYKNRQKVHCWSKFCVYFCTEKTIKAMKNLHQFGLRQLSELLNGDDDSRLLDDYISENLVVARNPPVTQLLARLSSDTYVLPEMRVMIVTQGAAWPTVNLIPRHFQAGQAVFLSRNSIVRMGEFTDDVRGFGLSMTDELAGLAFPTLVPQAFDGRQRDFNFALAPEQLGRLKAIHSLLYDAVRSKRSGSQVVLHLVAAFLWQLNYYWLESESERLATLSREQKLFSDFVQLVSRYATQEHNIDFYARRLFISPRYMSTLVKAVSGKPAKQWIDEAITTRIKVELRHTDKSAAQIADEMNFPNASFFCKFFRRMTGTTTQAYRQRRIR